MKARAVVVIVGILAGGSTVVQPHQILAAQSCSANCAHVSVARVGSGTLTTGSTATVGLTFTQGPNDGQPGGIDETAALALTLGIPGGTGGTPLTLADCSLACVGGSNANNACSSDADCSGGGYCQVKAVKADAAIPNFKVVVENASCASGRLHCLCPAAGGTPDNFINLVVYGPNPLPTPGPSGIAIPTLPTGPQQLLTIDLKVGASASGTIPLHIYNEVTVADSQHPQFTALLSVGDKLAVDQTCSPLAVAGTAPCAAANSVSQLTTTDGSIVVPRCVGDCDGSGDVSISEIITMVNIALGSADISTCRAGDPDNSGTIEISEIIQAVNNALNGCP